MASPSYNLAFNLVDPTNRKRTNIGIITADYWAARFIKGGGRGKDVSSKLTQTGDIQGETPGQLVLISMSANDLPRRRNLHPPGLRAFPLDDPNKAKEISAWMRDRFGGEGFELTVVVSFNINLPRDIQREEHMRSLEEQGRFRAQQRREQQELDEMAELRDLSREALQRMWDTQLSEKALDMLMGSSPAVQVFLARHFKRDSQALHGDIAGRNLEEYRPVVERLMAQADHGAY